MFASMDLSNGWTITSRAELTGLSDEELARVLELARVQQGRDVLETRTMFVTAAEIENANRFREKMLAMAKALLEAPCGEPKC